MDVQRHSVTAALFVAGCSSQNNPMEPIANASRGLYVMSADGTNRTQLDQGGRSPSWRGNKITFSRGSPSEIHVMNADGSGVIGLITSTGWEVSSPCWSPDGSMIAFYRNN